MDKTGPYIQAVAAMAAEAQDAYITTLPKPKKTRGTYEKVRSEAKIGNNEKCPCGSNLKYKHCCKH